MNTNFTKLISVAEAAINAEGDSPEFAAYMESVYPANMLKYHKAVEEKDRKVDEAFKMIKSACVKKCRCAERVAPCPHCDPIMQGEDLYASTLAGFQKTLEEITK